VKVTEKMRTLADQRHQMIARQYRIRLNFFSLKAIAREYNVKWEEICDCVGFQFTSRVLALIHKSLRNTGEKVASLSVGADVEAHQAAKGTKSNDEDADNAGNEATNNAQDDDEKSDDDDEDGDDGQGTLRFGSKKEVDGYDDDDEEIPKTGGKKSTVDDNDDDENADIETGEKDGFGSSSKDFQMGEGMTSISVMPSVAKSSFFRGCYGKMDEGWIEVLVEFPVSMRKLLLVSLARNAASSALVRHCTGINKCHVMEKKDDSIEGGKQFSIQTEGVNFQRLWEMNTIDVTRLETNDIHRVLTTYGVEAARVSISGQIAAVFGVYGISVDPRHLGLLADYMTYNGAFKPLNRAGMEDSPSPFLQMSFETTMDFLTAATLNNQCEDILSPSAKVVLGQAPKHGTGCFDLLQPVTI